MLILKRKPQNTPTTTENTVDLDDENIIDIDETNFIDVDDISKKSAKKRRKSTKPSFLNSKISYFGYNSGEERKFSSSELD